MRGDMKARKHPRHALRLQIVNADAKRIGVIGGGFLQKAAKRRHRRLAAEIGLKGMNRKGLVPNKC